MQEYQRLLLNNKAWAMDKLAEDESFFERMALDQKPNFLWIGCSDSRVPAEEITQVEPGEIFVHRNVANLVVHTDMNMLSVLQYAVEVLKVKHVIVCGHYGCGGVKAAMSNKDLGLINKWLRSIKDVYHRNEQELNLLADEQDRFERLVELNVHEQVRNLAQTTIIQRSWKKFDAPHLHGWVYGLKTGLIKEILNLPPGSPVGAVYTYDFD
ncbi:carbonate dehydratase [Spirosoma sp. HMF3257]|uniref:Carbonic anhydrase n=1 Tax=Spirosoma telluris TaxID=2183553 RepID=A0A327NMB8_9BACT|nr:carbonate dehydratase [Spirosoma telluris]RAI76342.1 carbonate dehydratase [Spirosoma telluris]